MGKSIFKNFDPENIDSYMSTAHLPEDKKLDLTHKDPDSFMSDENLAQAPWLSALINQGISTCGTIQRYTVGKKNPLLSSVKEHSLTSAAAKTRTNDEFADLAKQVEELVKLRYADQNYLYPSIKSILSDRLEAGNLARQANTEVSGVSDAHIYALTCLWIIDDAITIASRDGITLAFCGSMLVAERSLAAATKSWQEAILVPEIAEIEKKKRGKKASVGHKKTEKGIAKASVRECWERRTAQYDKHGGRASLARTMLAQHPILETEKTITDWFRVWDDEKQM